MLTKEADIYEYVRMSYVDKNILGPLVHICIGHLNVHSYFAKEYDFESDKCVQFTHVMFH